MRDNKTIDGTTYQNFSVDGRIGFLEERHKYVDTKNPQARYRSVTNLLKDYHEPFNASAIATKVIADKRSKYFGLTVDEVLSLWAQASTTGTILHNYAEDILNGFQVELPKDSRARHVSPAVEDLFSQGYSLAKTELLVYSEDLRIAGQSDLLLKKTYGDETFYMIYDWKFLSKPLQKKSYYNMIAKRYKNMSGPFRYLNDCNWIHYSIQLALYQTLTGEPSLVKEKVLIEVTEDGYKFVPAYPMRVFWNEDGLQAIYETWNGKYYDSRLDKIINTKPEDIEGL